MSLIDTLFNFSKTHANKKTSLFENNYVNSSRVLILNNSLVSFVLSNSSSLGHLFSNLPKKSFLFKLSKGF